MVLLSVTCFLAVLALNADSFVIGIAYGVGQIRVSRRAKIGISLAAALALLLTLWLGNGLAGFLAEEISGWLSSVLLFFFGLMLLFGSAEENQLLSRPDRADRNGDCIISPREAIVLGIALSADSLGAGFSLGLLGTGWLAAPILVFVLNFCLLTAGEWMGNRLLAGKDRGLRRLGKGFRRLSPLIPGLVLILLAAWNITFCLLF